MKPKEPTSPAEPTHARPGSRGLDLMPWTIEQILPCVEFERDSKVNTILGLLVDQFVRERIAVRGPFWPLPLSLSLSFEAVRRSAILQFSPLLASKRER